MLCLAAAGAFTDH
ncbi:hypothetical protein VCHC41A1_2570, partial [Vibrio cholerae HC-41A1]